MLLPLLHWQTPYGTAMSYTVSTSYIYTVPVCPTVQFLSLCRLHLQSFFQNIDTCIRIPVMNRMAFGTLPDTNAQIFYPWISVATTAAGLTARIIVGALNFHTSPLYIPAFQKILPRKHSLSILTVYDSGSSP